MVTLGISAYCLVIYRYATYIILIEDIIFIDHKIALDEIYILVDCKYFIIL